MRLEKRLIFSASFAGLIWLLGLPPSFPVFGIPLTIQNAGIFLAAFCLGATAGSVSVLIFLGLAAIGLPVLTGGRGGIGVFVGPTAGFLFGYIICTFIMGLLIQKNYHGKGFFSFFLIGIIGVIVLYLCGFIWLVLFFDMSVPAAVQAVILFIPFDIAKVILAASTGLLVKRYYPLL